MIGRTHGVHAEPMTFGLKLALWHAELQRELRALDRARATIAYGKLSGAVGTFSHLPPEVEEGSGAQQTPRLRGPTPSAISSLSFGLKALRSGSPELRASIGKKRDANLKSCRGALH